MSSRVPEHTWDTVRGRLPLLQTVRFTVLGHCDLSKALMTAPRLRCVKLLIIPTPSQLPSLVRLGNIPWFQITHLAIDTHDYSAANRILAHAPRIECLRLTSDASRGWTRASSAYTHIVHRVMSSLHITGDDVMVGHYLNYVTLPALCHLTMRIASSGACSLVTRSQCNLHSLHILDPPGVQPLLLLLELCPALRELSVVYTNHSVFGALKLCRGRSNHLLPNLRALDLKLPWTSPSIGDFIAMAESRCAPEALPLPPGCVRLEHVNLHFAKPHALPDDTVYRLRRLGASGMRVTFLVGFDKDPAHEQLQPL
ncbi:hypothetical protein HWV62_26666 [Athelia sp. TMB]|nr:hypothetical protein HWV62_26666 [Athelia sp. TMB]